MQMQTGEVEVFTGCQTTAAIVANLTIWANQDYVRGMQVLPKQTHTAASIAHFGGTLAHTKQWEARCIAVKDQYSIRRCHGPLLVACHSMTQWACTW